MDIITYAMAKSNATELIEALPKGIVYRGAVNYVNNLPNNADVGDAYTVMYTGSSGTNPDGREFAWGKYNGSNTWIELGPDISQYQKLLVSGQNIKTINGNSVLGSGDLSIINAPVFDTTKPNGRYTLVGTLNNGTVTYTWEVGPMTYTTVE